MRNIVYALIDPRSLLVRYIGQSSRGMTRPRMHLNIPPDADQSHRGRWLRELARDGGVPIIVVLDVCERADLSITECWWIAYGRGCGWNLTNMTDGGEGTPGVVRSPEYCAKMSAQNRRRVWTAESRAKISGDLSPAKRPEVRAKISGDLSPTKRPEVRARMREASARRWTPEAREDARRTALAERATRVYSTETRARLGEASKKRWATHRSSK